MSAFSNAKCIILLPDLRVWLGDEENRRKRNTSDILPLDVVLNCFEETTMEFK